MSTRDKYLTEITGECWHEFSIVNRCMVFCKHCDHKEMVEYGKLPLNKKTFSTWQGFGKLKEFSEKQSWWGEFIIDGKDSDGAYIFFSVKSGAYLHVEDINPDRFADAVYEFLSSHK